MITAFYMMLMTNHLPEQMNFYKTILGLDILFESDEAVGFGLNNRLHVLLRLHQEPDSHHSHRNKNPLTLTFKCEGDVNHYAAHIKKSGFKIRELLTLDEVKTHYLFIDDVDGNDVCLSFDKIEND